MRWLLLTLQGMLPPSPARVFAHWFESRALAVGPYHTIFCRSPQVWLLKGSQKTGHEPAACVTSSVVLKALGSRGPRKVVAPPRCFLPLVLFATPSK